MTERRTEERKRSPALLSRGKAEDVLLEDPEKGAYVTGGLPRKT
jgi:hypothetical protein